MKICETFFLHPCMFKVQIEGTLNKSINIIFDINTIENEVAGKVSTFKTYF